MYTTKQGRTFNNPAYGKMMDSAEPEQTGDDDKKETPTIRIIVESGKDGGFTTDGGDGLESHADKSALLDHLSSSLPDDESDDSDDQPAATPAASTAPASSGLMGVIKGLTSKK